MPYDKTDERAINTIRLVHAYQVSQSISEGVLT